MLTNKNTAHFPIERLNLENKFKFPKIRDLNAKEVIRIYNNFIKLFPANNNLRNATQVSKSLTNILDNFDALFLDAFGVLNIGNNLISGITETINKARDKGIILIILTNGSSFSSSRKIKQLYDLGLEFSFDEIISSRDVAERFLSLNQPEGTIGVLGNKDEIIKIQNKETLNLEYNLDEFERVNSFLFLGTSNWDPLFQDLLKDALLTNPRPFFVSNPDIVAPHVNGFSIEPAFYTFHMINDGVNLPIWFGKPFPQIFEMALERVEKITGKNLNLSRIGMVGDTLHTDILGANSFGVKSILMTNHGLFKNEKISHMIKSTGIIPDFIVQNP